MQVIDRPLPGVYPISFFTGNVFAGFSGRSYPRAHFPDFLQAAGLLPDALIRPKQVHGSEITIISRSAQKMPLDLEADGLLTHVPGPILGILTADCIPAFFWDPVQNIAGLAHAGWRGLKADILQKMVTAMQGSFNSKPEQIQVVLGPFIRRCCYEVGREFAGFFPAFYTPVSREKGWLDLSAAAKEKLAQAGILPSHSKDSGICTSCSNNAFFSARRGDAKERILSVIQIR